MDTINILVEAKKEYTSQLQKILTPRIYEGFKSIYDDIIKLLSKELEEKKTQSSSLIKTYQKMLKEIPQWNQDIINNEYSRIEKLSNCDYIDNLIEAVFITNTKILTSVQINDTKALNIKISIPQSPHFIHKCYMECAKEIYKNPYIYDQSRNLTPKEKHNNLREALSLIDLSINNAIRDLLPIRDILKQGLTKNVKEVSEVEVNSSEASDSNDDDNDDNDNDDNSDDTDDAKVNVDANVDANADVVSNIDDILNDKAIIDGKDAIDTIDATEKKSIIHEEEVINIPLEKEELSQTSKEENNNLSDIISEYSNNKISEIKEIIYNNVGSKIPQKLQSIEKISNENNNNNIIINNNKEIEIIYEKKQPNPFIKNVKNKKFLKIKNFGLDKNNSFYKKKYEENSANFHSVSEKDNLNSLNNLSNLSNLSKTATVINNDTVISVKVSKNQIKLDGDSSDEDEDDNIDI